MPSSVSARTFSKYHFLLFTVLIILVISMPWLFYLWQNQNYYGLSTHISVPAIPDHDIPPQGISLIFFGYLNCGVICPQQFLTLTRLHTQLSDSPVNFLFVTLAPDQDNHEELARAMKAMGTNFSYYRPDSILAAQQLAMDYTDIAARQTLHGLTEINHKGSLLAVTADNTLRLVYSPGQTDLKKIEADLIKLIALPKDTGE